MRGLDSIGGKDAAGIRRVTAGNRRMAVLRVERTRDVRRGARNASSHSLHLATDARTHVPIVPGFLDSPEMGL